MRLASLSFCALLAMLPACDGGPESKPDGSVPRPDAADRSNTVSWEPLAPQRGGSVTVWSRRAGQVHWGVDDWKAPSSGLWPVGTVAADEKAVDSPMTRSADGRYSLTLGPLPESVGTVEFVVKLADGTWDNNGGADYRIVFGGAAADAGALPQVDAGAGADVGGAAPDAATPEPVDAGGESPDAQAAGPDAATNPGDTGPAPEIPGNPDSVGHGARKTIVIDGANTSSEWGSDTLLIRDPAADDARFLGTNWCAHEPPWDYVALHAAWDDTYLYVGVQYANVTDVLDGNNVGSSAAAIHSMDVIQFLAFDTVPGQGYGTGGDMWKKDHAFKGPNLPDFQLYFHSNFSQEGTYLSKWDGKALTQFTDGLKTKDLKGKGGRLYVGATLPGVDPKADDANPGQYGAASVDYLTRGHATTYDTFFELQIPLASLGLTAARLDHGVIGVFAANGDGSAVDSIPDDAATRSTTGVSASNSPLEWSVADDDDEYTSPFALIGTP